jgi:mannose-6-phosphate isomerase-like protein (cupin superfamily)
MARFACDGLTPERWSNGPSAVYGVHDHPYGKVLIVAQGSICFTVGGNRQVAMKPNDRLDLPPRTPHSAVVGPEGVVCFEAHVSRFEARRAKKGDR